jgi:hypothetical protein
MKLRNGSGGGLSVKGVRGGTEAVLPPDRPAGRLTRVALARYTSQTVEEAGPVLAAD